MKQNIDTELKPAICPICGREYDGQEAAVVKEERGLTYLETKCFDCKNSYTFQTIENKGGKMSHIIKTSERTPINLTLEETYDISAGVIKEHCNIIPPKKRDKVVKAWAVQYRDRIGALKFYANEHKALMPVKNIPCTITIKADIWEKLKEKK